MIVLDGVTKRYGAKAVVDDVSLALGDVGITSIIGANGAGKSTLLSLIGRLLPLSSGRVTIDDLDITTAQGDDLARRMSILRQENHISARLTVRDLVGFGRYPHSKGRPGPDDLAAVDQALDYLDLTDLSTRFLDELSGGQRQRAYIAMVLAQDTHYVLLDEPLNSLDLKHSLEIMRLLRRMADDLDKRILIVLHDINIAAAHSDKIVAMADGHIVAAAHPDEVVTPEILEAVFDIPIDVRQIDGRKVALCFG
ncbi:MAG: ATP-binding cassette domain-containing protein [Propionibacteriaceae bacterium]|jgi:iron complex transport system ATP-binding protein|nr:ATP-binding cassette domain-containing protein [Propionibacteriaceae bacterium]